jgi:hypothetical protein
LDDNVDIKRSWGSIRENIKISATEILDYYGMQNPTQLNGDNMNNGRHETCRNLIKKWISERQY